MRFSPFVLTLCVLAQLAPAVPESTLNLLCPGKKTPLRARLKNADHSPNEVDRKGKTALMLAAEQDNRLAVCYLVAMGANVSIIDKSGKVAADYTHLPALRELLNASRETIGKAITYEQVQRKALEMGLGSPEARQQRLWQLVATPHSLEDIRELVSMGADLNAPDAEGHRLIHISGLTPEYLAFLVRKGYRLQPNPKSNTSPLRGDMNTTLAQLILALGHTPEMSDEMGILWASLFTNNVTEVKALLSDDKSYAKLHTPDKRPLLALAQSAAMVHALIVGGANAKEKGLLTAIIRRMGDDPRRAEVFSALISAGAKLPPNALADLCRSGRAEAPVLQVLLSAGADAKKADAEGNTPLHLLLLHNTDPSLLADSIKTLVKAGADLKEKNADGKSPEALIKAIGRDDLTKLLKKKK